MQDDARFLKRLFARQVATREAVYIAGDMGFQWVKILTPDDLLELTDNSDTSGIPTNELRIFHRASLIIEATAPDSAICYIAVEVSGTVNSRDTTRALRNAEFLTRFTGMRSYSAVAGLCRDDWIQGLIESGEVFWYELELDR